MQYFQNSEITGTTVLSQEFDLTLFPNPVIDVLRFESKEKIEKIEIYNLLGQSLAVFENNANQVSLNDLNPGIYSVKVTYATGNFAVRKIQKQ